MKLPDRNNIIISSARKSLLIFLLLVTLINTTFSQSPDKRTSDSSEKNFSEELYVKTDRDLYIAGENVWLNIFKLNGLTNTPVNLSKVVYIDLLDIYNNPVQQLKIGIDGNSGSCVLKLPDTLSTGNYILRSYSNWMKNFSFDLFSYKRISVINPFKSIDNIKIPPSDLIPDSVIFSPEGGHLIRGIETRIAFKSINKSGNPVALKGALVDEKNDTICYLSTEKNGYGWVSITPGNQKNIILVTTNKYFAGRRFFLPEIQNDGITISLSNNNSNSSRHIEIRCSHNFTISAASLYLRLKSASLLDFRKELTIGSNYDFSIPKKDLPPGLSHLTIIDDKENQLAGRWIYNETEQNINYAVNIQNKDLFARDKVKIDVSATDSKGAPVESDFTISVVKSFTLNNNGFSNNKYRQLPEFATLSTETTRADINDYLILYSGNDPVINKGENELNSEPAYLPELEGHLISGNIRDRVSGKPLSNENITLSFVGKVALCQFTKTDERGNFNFVTKEKGLCEIVIEPLSEEINDCYIDLNSPFASTFNSYNHGLFYIDPTVLGDINNAIISMQINNIYDPYFQKASIDTSIALKHNFYGKPDNTILMSNYIELTSMKEAVKEIMPSVSTIKKNDKTNFKLVYKSMSQPFENSPLVLVDGVPVHDIDKVLKIASKDIEKIDVLTTRYFIDDNVLDGILHFISKKGNLDVLDFDRSVYRLEYELVQNNSKFYSPDYSTDSVKNNHIPDFRNTLYWNPDMHTDNTGKATVEFYSSDETVEYTINIEGISPDGKRGSKSFPLLIKTK